MSDTLFIILFAASCVVLCTSAIIYILTLPPPTSIYEDGDPTPLLRYLTSDNHLTIENLDDYFTNRDSARSAILAELRHLTDSNYTERTFEDGLYYYRLTEWGIIYLDYLEGR